MPSNFTLPPATIELPYHWSNVDANHLRMCRRRRGLKKKLEAGHWRITFDLDGMFHFYTKEQAEIMDAVPSFQ